MCRNSRIRISLDATICFGINRESVYEIASEYSRKIKQ